MGTTSNRLRWISLWVALVGLADSIYLTWIKLAHQVAACSTIGDCETVNSSVYSEVYGVPIALFGVLAYLVLVGILLFEPKITLLQRFGIQAVYGLSLAGVLYSAYLTYVEIVILRAICPFCVVSALALLILFILTVIRMTRPASEVE